MKKPTLSVVIPTLNREAVLVDTIRDVLKQTFKGFELVVVDQTEKHKPKTERFLRQLDDPRFRYFRVSPPSLTAARNFAFTVVRAPIAVFIDDDVILSKDFLKHHAEVYKTRPQTTAVAGRVNDLFHKWPESAIPLHFDTYGQGHGSFNCPVSQPCESFPGGNMSIRVAFAQKLGGFDPSYTRTAVREESDMAFRIHAAGGQIYYSAEATLDHLAAPYGGTRIKIHPLDNIAYYSNELLFALKFVKLRHLPFGLTKRLWQAWRGVGLKGKVRRTGLFLRGLVEAIGKRLWPIRTVSTEIVEEQSA